MHSIWIESSDGLRIHGLWNARQPQHRRIIVVAPGYTQCSETPIMLHAANVLHSDGDTLSLDFRGTGRSDGRYTFAGSEILDLQAAVRWAAERYEEVVVAGFSMGASISIQAAAIMGPVIQRLLLVSVPTTLGGVVRSGGPILQGLSFLRNPSGIPQRRWAGGTLRLRYGSPFHRGSALVVAPQVHVPATFVIGDRDRLVLPRLSRAVFDRYGGPKVLEVIPGGRHAEYLALDQQEQFCRCVKSWLTLPATRGSV